MWWARARWERWTAPTTEGELAQRRERVLLTTLAGAVLLSLATQAVQVLSAGVALAARGDLPRSVVLWWLVNVVVGLGFLAMLRLARAGDHRRSAALLVACFYVLAVALCLVDGLLAPMGPLLLLVALLLAAILLGARAAAVVVALGGTALLVVNALQTADLGVPLEPGDGDVGFGLGAGLALLLGFVAHVVRLAMRDGVVAVDAVLSASPERSPLRALRTRALSVREIEVVQLVASGLSNDAIARRLFVSPRTVQTHVANAMRKCDCANRTALGVLAVREGLVPLEEPGRDEGSVLPAQP